MIVILNKDKSLFKIYNSYKHFQHKIKKAQTRFGTYLKRDFMALKKLKKTYTVIESINLN